MGNISSTVTVSEDSTGKVTVTAQDVDLPVTTQGAQNIVFSLSVGSGVTNTPFKFPDDNDTNHPNNGINITNAGTEFDSYNKLGNGNVQVRDLNNNTTDYTYSITVLDSTGAAHVSDPAIRNGGSD